VADWGGGMSAKCKPRGQLFANAGSGWPHSALRYHWLMPIRCHCRCCKTGRKLPHCWRQFTPFWALPFFCLPLPSARFSLPFLRATARISYGNSVCLGVLVSRPSIVPRPGEIETSGFHRMVA